MSEIIVVKPPPTRIIAVVRPKRTVVIRQPGPRGIPGPRGYTGDTGPPSIYVSPTPPLDPIINPLWLDIS